MAHVVLLNLIFFIPATCGATAFALFILRFLRMDPPEPEPPHGGSKMHSPRIGPDDLARSA